MSSFSVINFSRAGSLERQSFHDFITELKKLSAECEFEILRDSLIKDMIVCGTMPIPFVVRERRFREFDLTLSRAGPRAISVGQSQFVIFNLLSHCLKETIGFDVKASFASRP